MRYDLKAAGFEHSKLVVETGLSGAKLLVNGKPAPKGPDKGEFVVPRDDGTDEIIQLKGQYLDPVPKVIIDLETTRLAPPLPWYAWAWSALPALLVVLGGLIGGALGGAALAINVGLFRTDIPPIGHFATTAVVTGGTVFVYFLAAGLLTLIF